MNSWILIYLICLHFSLYLSYPIFNHPFELASDFFWLNIVILASLLSGMTRCPYHFHFLPNLDLAISPRKLVVGNGIWRLHFWRGVFVACGLVSGLLVNRARRESFIFKYLSLCWFLSVKHYSVFIELFILYLYLTILVKKLLTKLV